MNASEISGPNNQSPIVVLFKGLLASRVSGVGNEPLTGFKPKGPETEGICGDCGDGACEGCP